MAIVLVISFTDLKRDPRVRRQINALRGSHTVIAAGTGDPQLPDVRFVGCQRAPRTVTRTLVEAADLLLHRYEAHYARLPHVRELRRKLDEISFDLAIANDLDALPLALRVAGSRPVILDAHEYAPREVEERLLWRIFKQGEACYLCRTYLKRVARAITVSDGIAKEYAQVFGVSPLVVNNAAPAHELTPRTAQAARIRMVHHGHAMPTRGIENMIEVMRSLDNRFELDLMLVPTFPRYLSKLRHMSRGDKRIRFVPPVPMQELVQTTNAYDIGLYLLQPSSFNNLHALPNKFFEFIQARLAVAIGPSPEMASIVREFGCGVVAEIFSPESLGSALNRLTAADIDRMKAGSDRAARVYNAEINADKLRMIVASVLEGQR
jgi:hypothetical protein